MEKGKKLLTAAALLLCLPAPAQNVRLTTLQNARNLVVTDKSQEVPHYYTVTAEQSKMIYRHNGQLTIDGDTFDPAGVSMRLKAMPRFVLEEVDHGLLAFRRHLTTGQWNTIIVPFSLTASQLRDAFGDDVQIAVAASAGDAEANEDVTTAVLEFQTVDLSASDALLQAGIPYLIKPSREPDLTEGEQTTVAYGNNKVSGPLYAIPGVTLTKGKGTPDNFVLRSPSDEVRLRIFGTYTARTGSSQVKPATRPLYMMGHVGRFSLLTEPTDVKAFNCWLENASKTDGIQLRFCLDGISEELTEPTGIHEELMVKSDRYATAHIYDLQGRRVNAHNSSPATLHAIPGQSSHDRGLPLKKGLYIINGKKVIIR